MATNKYRYIVNPQNPGKLERVLSDEYINSLISAQVSGGARVRAYRSSMQTISSDESMEKVLFNTEQWDVNDEFTNSEFTAKEAGYYLVIGEVRYFNFASASFPIGIGIYKNDNCQKSKNVQGAAYNPCSIELSDTVYCDIGDIIDIRTTQNSGGDLFIFGIASKVATNVIINKI